MMSKNSDNLIDELPDDILVSIISLLDLKEAAQTSILSRRWVKLWTYTRVLCFYSTTLMSTKVEKSVEVRRSRFINWVNHILQLYHGTNLDEFSVWFQLDDGQCCKLDIDRWIIFAFEKRTEILDLNFSSFRHVSGYTLTIELVSHCAATINFLKEVSFIALDVSGEVVEYILSNCPLLQCLTVAESKSLVRLRVSSPCLKNLQIKWCPLEYIEISLATNLESFSYRGSRPSGNIKNIPNLVNLCITGECAHFLVENNLQFSGFLSQLETLELDLELKRIKSFSDFTNMKNLKHLELNIDVHLVKSLLVCAELLEASSLLQRLTLKFFHSEAAYMNDDCLLHRGSMKVPEPEQMVHEHLKVIECFGFKGRAIEVELLLCLLARAGWLEQLIIHLWSLSYFGFGTGHSKEARTIAEQFKTRLPPGAELVVLESSL